MKPYGVSNKATDVQTRLLLIPYQLFLFNPYNGYDVEIDDELARDYLRAMKRLDELHTKIAELLLPFAKKTDEDLFKFFERNGMRCLLPVEDRNER